MCVKNIEEVRHAWPEVVIGHLVTNDWNPDFVKMMLVVGAKILPFVSRSYIENHAID